MVSYIPVLTTLFSVFFLSRIIPHYLAKKSPYLLWWTLGVLTFGMGTLTESINAIFGWSEWNTKIWYIVGALLGGYPLAQGTIYLLMKKRFADISAMVCSAAIIIGAVCVLLSPIAVPEGFDERLRGDVLGWQWVRRFSPFINTYAFIFLYGGAVFSAVRYAYENGSRFLGNVVIAVGALLPIVFLVGGFIFLFVGGAGYSVGNVLLATGIPIAAFLLGGAIYTAVKYFANEQGRTRLLGNILIAVGALLPAIGGTATRFGHVEILYITELIGLFFIYGGYDMMRKDRSASLHANQQVLQGSLSGS